MHRLPAFRIDTFKDKGGSGENITPSTLTSSNAICTDIEISGTGSFAQVLDTPPAEPVTKNSARIQTDHRKCYPNCRVEQ